MGKVAGMEGELGRLMVAGISDDRDEEGEMMGM